MAIGIILGIVVGLLSGASFLVLVQAINGAKIASSSAIMTILAQLVIVPSLWIGAPMLAAGPLPIVPLREIIGPYVASLAVSLAFIVAVPLLAWIRGMAGPWVLAAPEEGSK